MFKGIHPVPVLIVGSDELARARKPAVELRVDLFKRMPDLLRTIEKLQDREISVMVTARRKIDGGRWVSQEPARRELLLSAGVHADAVDVEGDVIPFLQFAKKPNCLIVSHHDMIKTPSNATLDRILGGARDAGADRFKIAALAKKPEDAERLADWALEMNSPDLPITAVSMGTFGTWTRWILPVMLGGPAYAPIGTALAPGQLPYKELVGLLHHSADIIGRAR